MVINSTSSLDAVELPHAARDVATRAQQIPADIDLNLFINYSFVVFRNRRHNRLRLNIEPVLEEYTRVDFFAILHFLLLRRYLAAAHESVEGKQVLENIRFPALRPGLSTGQKRGKYVNVYFL
jgi:hypothetical protein